MSVKVFVSSRFEEFKKLRSQLLKRCEEDASFCHSLLRDITDVDGVVHPVELVTDNGPAFTVSGLMMDPDSVLSKAAQPLPSRATQPVTWVLVAAAAFPTLTVRVGLGIGRTSQPATLPSEEHVEAMAAHVQQRSVKHQQGGNATGSVLAEEGCEQLSTFAKESNRAQVRDVPAKLASARSGWWPPRALTGRTPAPRTPFGSAPGGRTARGVGAPQVVLPAPLRRLHVRRRNRSQPPRARDVGVVRGADRGAARA